MRLTKEVPLDDHAKDTGPLAGPFFCIKAGKRMESNFSFFF
jgi:hypothetical protein